MQETIDLLITYDWIYWILAGILGACIGSYINVLIYRYPKLLAYQWHKECHEFLKLQPTHQIQKPPFSLNWPSSHCPHCHHPIRFYHNIPLLGFLLLRGRCYDCQRPISLQYPLVEFFSILFSVLTAIYFGFGWQGFAALVLTWWLLCQAGIDIQEQLIPDQITYIGLWLGLLVNSQTIFVSPIAAIYGAVLGYLSLWLIFHIYKFFTGKEGMGYGDFKLLAMLGAWLGIASIPWIIMLSSVFGLMGGIILMATKRLTRETPIPFGPYLALSGWFVMLFGHDLLNWYLRISGMVNY